MCICGGEGDVFEDTWPYWTLSGLGLRPGSGSEKGRPDLRNKAAMLNWGMFSEKEVS